MIASRSALKRNIVLQTSRLPLPTLAAHSTFNMDASYLSQNQRLIIAFEVDRVKSGELGAQLSRHAVDEDADPSRSFLVEEQAISGSYLSAELATVQRLDANKSLLILAFQCHPASRRHFANAKITWKFRPNIAPGISSASSPDPPPKVVAHAPKRSLAGRTDESNSLNWSLALQVQVGIANNVVGVQAGRQNEVQKTVSHAMTMTGTVRGNRTECVWTLEGNKSSSSGIPSHFQVAVVLEHEGLFVIELNVKAELRGGLIPTRHLQSKKSGDGRGLLWIVDVEKWENIVAKCGPIESEWMAFMETVTGEVPAAVVEFQQRLV